MSKKTMSPPADDDDVMSRASDQVYRNLAASMGFSHDGSGRDHLSDLMAHMLSTIPGSIDAANDTLAAAQASYRRGLQMTVGSIPFIGEKLVPYVEFYDSLRYLAPQGRRTQLTFFEGITSIAGSAMSMRSNSMEHLSQGMTNVFTREQQELQAMSDAREREIVGKIELVLEQERLTILHEHTIQLKWTDITGQFLRDQNRAASEIHRLLALIQESKNPDLKTVQMVSVLRSALEQYAELASDLNLSAHEEELVAPLVTTSLPRLLEYATRQNEQIRRMVYGPEMVPPDDRGPVSPPASRQPTAPNPNGVPRAHGVRSDEV